MKKLSFILALLFALTLTACSDSADTYPGSDYRQSTSEPAAPTESSTTTGTAAPTESAAKPDPEETTTPEPFIPGARYYRLTDGSIYTAPNDDGLLVLGFAMVRENADIPDGEAKWQRLGIGDEWNGLQVEFAQSGWWDGGDTYAYANYTLPHHQYIKFLGEMTFTGKAQILCAADGETPEYTVFMLDEECGAEMPVFPTVFGDSDNGCKNVFFLLYHEDYEDVCSEITDRLLEGEEVNLTITTDNFLWEYSDYGMSIDGNSRGRFNTILSFEIT